MDLTGKRIVVTGGTGSLGSTLVRQLVNGNYGTPERITVFSRDEDKQHRMRQYFMSHVDAEREQTGNTLFDMRRLTFKVGDIRDYGSLVSVMRQAQIVFHAAALKQVPNCEYAPFEAVRTNIIGTKNIVRAISEYAPQVELVVGLSTDKACEPINVMGMTKALQERTLIQGNMECENTRFVCVRYGNVIGSRGSVIPMFLQQIRERRPVTLTHKDMTRFLITPQQAIETIMCAAASALPGETYVRKIPSARMLDLVQILLEECPLPIEYLGIRPGEKMHEVLVSEHEIARTVERDSHYVILPYLAELQRPDPFVPALTEELSSRMATGTLPVLRELLRQYMARLASWDEPIVNK